jgi:glycosyltransferase involved in cell wall biosynthesis
MMKPKVLLLQGGIFSYRIPIYEIIAQKVDLTIGYTHKNECNEKISFNTVKLSYKKFKGLVFIRKYFYKLCSEYDVVIFMADPHYISYCLLPFIYKKYKVISWSIGIRASYTRPYNVDGKKNVIDKLYKQILRKSDAVIFYMKEPIKFWNSPFIANKAFTAHNTVVVDKNELEKNSIKNRILFVGTLYKEKGVYELIYAYIEAKKKCNCENFLLLDIIGKGDEFDNLKNIVEKNKLSEHIFLHGAIYNEKILAKYFSKSIFCISPCQAGLSVLKSMGYGVPFVTQANAITGGERLNIITGENGLLYNNSDELIKIILDAYNCPQRYIKMGINAAAYYESNATPQLMAKGVLDAIEFVLK